jgi:hypothetical protein
MAHGAGVISVAGHRRDGCRQSCPIAHSNGHAASVAFDKAGYFTVFSANEKRGPARCGDAGLAARLTAVSGGAAT